MNNMMKQVINDLNVCQYVGVQGLTFINVILCVTAGDEHQKVHPTPLGEGECCGPEMIIKGQQLCDSSMQEVVDIPENRPTHNDVCVPKDRVNNLIRQTYDNRREVCVKSFYVLKLRVGQVKGLSQTL